ncbi:MAG: MFS transporter [Acidimicrobiia bacterium]|nr:MFS transporter [Acidimicrobiia bacterium]
MSEQASGAATREDTFASLRIPEYRRLWFTGVCSFGAIPAQSIARGFLAFELTGRNSALGLVLLAMGVPMLVMTPIGGVVADRFPKRTVLLVSTGLLWISASGIGLMLFVDRLEFWMLVASSVLQGMAFSLLGPTRMAFSAELAGREHLANAILLAQLSMNGTRVLGPSIAGALLGISVLGPRSVYVAVAVILTLGFWLTARLPAGDPVGAPSLSSPLADVTAGLRYVRSEPAVLWPVVMSLAVIALAFPYVAFLPSLVDEVYGVGPGWLGALSTASAVGAVVASLSIARIGAARFGDRAVAVAAVVFAGLVVVLGLVPSVVLALVVVLLAGGANAGFQALNNSLVLLRADEAYHGRVQSLLMLGWSAFGIFAAPLGAIADAVGLQRTLVAMGALAIAAVAILHALIVRSAPGAAAQVAATQVAEAPQSVSTALDPGGTR